MTSVSQVETSSPTGPLLHTSQADIEHQLGAAFSHHSKGQMVPLSSLTPYYTVLVWMVPPVLHMIF